MNKPFSKDEFKVTMRIGHCWLSNVCSKFHLTGEVLKSYNDEDRLYMWEEVRLYLLRDVENASLYRKIISYIMDHEQISDVKVIQSENGLIHLLVKVQKCQVYLMLERNVLNYSKEIATSNGNISLRVKAKKRSHVQKVMTKLIRKNEDIEILNIVKINKDEELTILQDRIVRMAWSLGYYDIPKKITIKEMSDILGIAPATLHEILKRAERKIINKYVKSI